VIAWYLLTNDCDDRDLGGDFFIRRDTDRARQRAVAQLQALGDHLTLQPAAQHPEDFTFQDSRFRRAVLASHHNVSSVRSKDQRPFHSRPAE